MALEVILGCDGIEVEPAEGDRLGLRRCFNCVDGGAGTYLLGERLTAEINQRLEQGLPVNDLLDNLNDSRVISPCPRGGRRWATSTIVGS